MLIVCYSKFTLKKGNSFQFLVLVFPLRRIDDDDDRDNNVPI